MVVLGMGFLGMGILGWNHSRYGRSRYGLSRIGRSRYGRNIRPNRLLPGFHDLYSFCPPPSNVLSRFIINE